MERREFVVTSGLLVGMPATPSDDEAALKKAINDYYSVYFRERDIRKYRALLTDDYLLLENGEIMNVADDIALIPKPGDLYERTDAFDFKQIKVSGGVASVVYFLSSVVTNKNGTQKYRWLESAILRRSNSKWLIGLLHSTKIVTPAA